MKDLKFRVWDTKSKKYLEFIPPEEYMLDSDEWSHSSDEESLVYPSGPLPDFDGRLVREQFIGTKDKNDKEIYEGDIVKFITKVELGDAEENFGVVSYSSDYALYQLDKYGTSYLDGVLVKKSIEIVGNVHENIDLVEKYKLL